MCPLGVVGTGHVGLVTAGAITSIGHDVVDVDSDQDKIRKLQEGTMPFYESGMDDLLRTQGDTGRVRYSDDLREAIAGSDVVFVCGGTPSRQDGSPNLSYVQATAVGLRARHRSRRRSREVHHADQHGSAHP